MRGSKPGKMSFPDWWGYPTAFALVALATWLKYLAEPKIIPADVPILYLLAIVPTAIFFGFGPSILVCLLSVIAYDYFFIAPEHQFTVSITEAPILGIFLAVGLLFSYLASNMRQKNRVANQEIAERKRSEAELVKYRDHLEDLVKQRTTNLEKANQELAAEIAEHQKTEAALKESEARANALIKQLRAISDCNQAIVRATDEQILSTSVCRILCEVVGYRMAWVGLIERDQAKTVRPAACFGEYQGYLDSANITWADTERGRGPTGTAARTGKTDFCQDFLTEAKTAPWREEALKRGFRSSIAVPLRYSHGPVFAVLTLYSAEPAGFTAGEVKLLEELAGDLAFGIETVRTKKERDRAEAELQNYAARVANTNRELAAANQELEAFSYSVSHDLRAPLRGINGFSSALSEEYADKLDERGQEYLENIRESSRTMGQLIDDLLNLSRINRTEMSVGEVNLSEIVSVIAEDLQKYQPDRKAEIRIAPGVTAAADTTLVTAMLRNLLENAWKFTAKRAPARIEFGLLEDQTPPVYYIKDNGIGFDMQYADKLFKPFSRLHSQNEYTGTGIGLANVQRIINRHGGKVWAEGEIDQGAAFYFTLEKMG
jgi:K+-sensing histidine kinase KdpD